MMMGECGVILKVVEPVKSFVFDSVSEYVGYIGSCEDNLGALHKSLSDVCNKKDDINKEVLLGKDKLEEITTEAASWLQDVRMLVEGEELKSVMYKDIETAKFVVKIMRKKDLKRLISKESEMQELVVRVMKKLKEEIEHYKEKEEEGMRKIREVDYKHVAEVVVELMKDTIEEFKKLLKEDKKMAVIAMRTWNGRELHKLTKGDQEMEEIVKEAWNTSDEELWPNHVDEESNTLQPLLVKVPEVDVGKNRVNEAANKLFSPLANLVTPLKKLLVDANFKKAVPESEVVKLGVEVIDGLLIKGRGLKKEMDDNTKQQRGCCCCSLFSLCNDYHHRYLLSKSAAFLAKYIQDEFITSTTYPRGRVTLGIRAGDMKPIPTQFLKGLDSRTQLLDEILVKLFDDQVDFVGVFGMGGTGKTTLAKEVIKMAENLFSIKVMVEITETPDIFRIQSSITDSIGLPLHDVNGVAQRATMLYNRLISEKEKKVLIILDNVWKKLDLDAIGIPCTCKLLLTTREREVCRVMGVPDVNIIKVGLMNAIESRELFKSLTGNKVDVAEYRNVVKRLLSKCNGLPLAIVATANSLTDKDLSSWEKFANDLEKPVSSQVTRDYRHIYSILEASYKFIEVDEKRIFFLLACLSPLGSSISVESLMRYGIGLNLFQHVNKLCEAMEQAATWVNELMLSSMFLEGDVKGDVKIHDIVRAFAISFASKGEGHKFMVESIPRWLDNKTFKEYTAMSLTSKNDYSRLNGVEACKLQILILNGDLAPNFGDLFFNGMVNLEVLSLSNMNFQPSLPESMRQLKELRTLCMEGCKLGNIGLVGELVNLLVLCLRESTLENLPNEVGNLSKLRLLDLNGCTSSKLPLIPTVVLGKLSKLEGLYMFNYRKSVFEKSDYEEIESSSLPYLNELEINVEATEELPIDGQSMANVDKFRVCVGYGDFTDETRQKFCSLLRLYGIDDISGFLKKSCHQVLLKKADFLEISHIKNFEDIVPQLDDKGFRSLRSLELSDCSDIVSIVDGRTTNNLIAFPCLQSLSLGDLGDLKMVCNGDVSPSSFSNLKTIRFSVLKRLEYGLPVVPCNVNEIYVSYCDFLEFLFIEDEEVLPAKLPFLKSLELVYVPLLLSLVGPKEFVNTSSALQGPRVFFDGKIVLPSLERFVLGGCKYVVTLWSEEVCTTGFQNLRDIVITDCGKLSSVGSFSVFSLLVQLKTLRVEGCKEMTEIVSVGLTQETEIGEQITKFPQLESLVLEDLSNLESFYVGGSKLEFPKLKVLKLDKLGCMKNFAKLENSSALFHENIAFPCLEKLRVIGVNDEVMGLWDTQSSSVTSNPATMLREIALDSLAVLREIPYVSLKNLSSLTLVHFQDDSVIFSSSDFAEKEGSVSIYSQLPNLEELKVEGSKSLKELFGKEDCNSVMDALMLFCGQIKTLEFNDLRSLNLIPLHLFKNIASLTLSDLKWSYLISAPLLEDSLNQLQYLTIENCIEMKALVINVGSHIKLPSLKHLGLCNLESLIGISSRPKKEAALLFPSLESLKIDNCEYLECFWSGSIVAPRLQDVSVENCDSMQQFFVSKDTIELPSLEEVGFWQCESLKSISSGSLITHKLKTVELERCYSMRCFMPGNPNHEGDLQLPSLEIVDIRSCPKLTAFSRRPILAPKFTKIIYDGEELSMLPYDDLNHFLQKISVLRDSLRSQGLIQDY